MKLEKFMTEVTKALLRDKNVVFWKYGDRVVITHDGFFAMIIPKNRNIFNCELSAGRPIPSDWDACKLRYTTELKQFDKKTACIFETEKGEKVYVNEKYVKYFDKNAEFYGASPKSAVFVEENGFLCGMIMPIYDRGVTNE